VHSEAYKVNRAELVKGTHRLTNHFSRPPPTPTTHRSTSSKGSSSNKLRLLNSAQLRVPCCRSHSASRRRLCHSSMLVCVKSCDPSLPCIITLAHTHTPPLTQGRPPPKRSERHRNPHQYTQVATSEREERMGGTHRGTRERARRPSHSKGHLSLGSTEFASTDWADTLEFITRSRRTPR
jgi:hypothetical protein